MPAAAAEPIVRLENVKKSFGATRAVDGLSLSVGRGEMFGIIGPDGAGKTTSLRMICGLIKPDARIYHHLLERFDLTAGDCVFIDDSAANVAGAEAVGITGLHFQSPERLRRELGELRLL
jgi:ABC-type lipopolysaccharide export system ATPase subunit